MYHEYSKTVLYTNIYSYSKPRKLEGKLIRVLNLKLIKEWVREIFPCRNFRSESIRTSTAIIRMIGTS